MPHTKPFSIVKASAGSGKTYKLASLYIALGLKNPPQFNRILGVTFTNKATAEMKERIIKLLRSLNRGDEEVLLNDLSSELGLSSEEIKKRSSELLSRILHSYSQFSITTIDSFFHKVIRSFARELGVQGSFSVELDLDNVTTIVIDNLLDEMSWFFCRFVVCHCIYCVDFLGLLFKINLLRIMQRNQAVSLFLLLLPSFSSSLQKSNLV
jgi:ATP-dependent exoDNAse (exonuclease V) beta subunit